MPEIENFLGQPVIDFGSHIDALDTSRTYRVLLDWESFDEGVEFGELLTQFEAHDNLEGLTSLIIGAWDLEMDGTSPEVVEQLISMASRMPNLTHLVFGDIYYEESEISWIENTRLTELVQAFPKLEYFKTRGGNGLSFEGLRHESLKTLIVETGGLGLNVVQEILAAHLPGLEHLELWTGSSYYGFHGTIEDYKPLFIGLEYPEKRYPFPKLKTLALKNSEISDDIAEALNGAPVMDLLETLDLSMGTFSNRGAEALLANEKLGNLKKLDVHSHFVTDEDLFDQLESRGLSVISHSQKALRDYDDGRFYVDVSE